MMKFLCYKTVTLVTLFSALFILSCVTTSSLEPPSSVRRQPVPERERKVNLLKEKYNAYYEWTDSLDVYGLDETIYTVDLQKVLIRDDMRPVLFVGYLRDLLIDEGAYKAHFSDVYMDIQITLECTKEIFEKLRKNLDRRTFNEAAVVARIDKVIKRESVKVLYPETIEYDVEFQVESFDVFIASGTCIDFVFTSTDRVRS